LKFYVNETYDAETETRLRLWSDGIETRPRRSKKRLETVTRPRCSRPRRQPWIVIVFCWHC